MLVVADRSPIIALVNIEQIDLLPRLFGQVIIPSAVAVELADAKRPAGVRRLLASRPAWLEVRSPRSVTEIPRLHAGETEAISLALELPADLLLVDDRLAYAAAMDRGIAAVGKIGVLERAARSRLVDLEDTFSRLGASDFWVDGNLLKVRLARFREG